MPLTYPNIVWIVDSGASHHMTNRRELHLDFKSMKNPLSVKIANGFCLEILGRGTVILNNQLKLLDTLNDLTLSFNFMSINKITKDNNCIVCFSQSKCWFSPSKCLLQETLFRENIDSADGENGL